MYDIEKFKGIVPPVSTILKEDGTLDKDGMANLIDYLIDAGVNGLFFLGTGGEFSQMSVDERMAIAEYVTQYVAKRVPVFIGTGSANTREALLLSEHAQSIGADAVVIINPYYWPLREENLLKHYGMIADAINIPMILYNFPKLTGQDLSPQMVLKLVEQHENIIGIKETVDSIGHIRDMIYTVKSKYPNFLVYAGYDDHLWPTLSLGGDGAINASVNFAPEISISLYQSFKEKNLKESLNMHKRLAFIPRIYNLDSPFINVIKEATKLRGIDVSTYVLPPAQQLSAENKEKLKEILEELHILQKSSI